MKNKSLARVLSVLLLTALLCVLSAAAYAEGPWAGNGRYAGYGNNQNTGAPMGPGAGGCRPTHERRSGCPCCPRRDGTSADAKSGGDSAQKSFYSRTFRQRMTQEEFIVALDAWLEAMLNYEYSYWMYDMPPQGTEQYGMPGMYPQEPEQNGTDQNGDQAPEQYGTPNMPPQGLTQPGVPGQNPQDSAQFGLPPQGLGQLDPYGEAFQPDAHEDSGGNPGNGSDLDLYMGWEALDAYLSGLLEDLYPQEAEFVGMPNPWTETDSLEEAAAVSGVAFVPPADESLPDGMAFTCYRAMVGTIEANYSDGQEKLMIRASSDTEGYQLSGDYNSYSGEWQEELDGVTVDCLGDGKKINVAVFKIGDVAYAVDMASGKEGEGLTPDALRNLMTGMQLLTASVQTQDAEQPGAQESPEPAERNDPNSLPMLRKA